MKKWSNKKNARRFYRMDMPLNIFITPHSFITDYEIHATGFDYFPLSVIKEIKITKQHLLGWVSKIQEHKDILNTLFLEIIKNVEFFGDCIENMSKGKSPKNNLLFWKQLIEQKEGFKSIESLHKEAPKTYQYLKLIEDKYLFYLNSLINSIQNSTPNHFDANKNLGIDFKIDELIETFKDSKFDNIPFVQSIICLYKLNDIYLNIYQELNQDLFLQKYPKQWLSKEINASMGGLSLLLNKRFQMYEKVDVYIYFPEEDKTILFEATIVNIKTLENENKERVSLKFEFPNGSYQNYLQSEIEKYELKKCLNSNLISNIDEKIRKGEII